jgi:anaphase-promoting complex subunit 2
VLCSVDADPARSSSVQQAGDVISKLVGIYGSKELFINEYRWAGGQVKWL